MGNSTSSPRRTQRPQQQQQQQQPETSPVPATGPGPNPNPTLPYPPPPALAPPPPGYPGLVPPPQYRPAPSGGYLPYYPPNPAQWGGYAPNGQYYAMQGNGQWVQGALPPLFRVPAPPRPPPPQVVEPVRTATIRNDVNLKRSTLRLEQDPENPGQYLVAFSFDATVPGSVSVFLLAKEGDSCSFTSLRPDLCTPQKIPFEKGLGQKFTQASGAGLSLSLCPEGELAKEAPGDVYPLVVRMETVPKNPPPDAQNKEDQTPGAKLPKWIHSQTTYATVDKHSHSGKEEYTAKVLKQKIWVDGMRYELQEIYGIEHGGGTTAGDTDSSSDVGKECVICMSEPRDTTVLPCRHMCMCSECAKVLRYQDNRCPICRQVVERLLEIRVPSQSKGTAGTSGEASAGGKDPGAAGGEGLVNAPEVRGGERTEAAGGGEGTGGQPKDMGGLALS